MFLVCARGKSRFDYVEFAEQQNGSLILNLSHAKIVDVMNLPQNVFRIFISAFTTFYIVLLEFITIGEFLLDI